MIKSKCKGLVHNSAVCVLLQATQKQNSRRECRGFIAMMKTTLITRKVTCSGSNSNNILVEDVDDNGNYTSTTLTMSMDFIRPIGSVRAHDFPRNLIILVFIYYCHHRIGLAVEIPSGHFISLDSK